MTAARVSEADLQRTVLEMARWHGVLAFHSTDPRRDTCAGFPDLVLLGDRVAFVELKTDRGRVLPDQQIWLDGLRAAGQAVYVIRPKDVADGTVQRLMRGLRK